MSNHNNTDGYLIHPQSPPLHLVRDIRASGSKSLLARIDDRGLHLFDRRNGGVNHLLSWHDLEQLRNEVLADASVSALSIMQEVAKREAAS